MTTDKTAEALADALRRVQYEAVSLADAQVIALEALASLAQPAQAEVTDYARMLGAAPTANEMDNLPHQDWCRWWRHGDICNCGAVTYPPTQPQEWPMTSLTDRELLERAAKAAGIVGEYQTFKQWALSKGYAYLDEDGVWNMPSQTRSAMLEGWMGKAGISPKYRESPKYCSACSGPTNLCKGLSGCAATKPQE